MRTNQVKVTMRQADVDLVSLAYVSEARAHAQVKKEIQAVVTRVCTRELTNQIKKI